MWYRSSWPTNYPIGNQWLFLSGFYHSKAMILKAVILGKVDKTYRPSQISSLELDSGLISVVARQWIAFDIIYDWLLGLCKEKRAKHWLARFGWCENKSLQENSEKNAEVEWRLSRGQQRPAGTLTRSRSKDSMLSLSMVIVQKQFIRGLINYNFHVLEIEIKFS